MLLEKTIIALFSFSLFANAMLFVPQAVKIIRKKQSKDLSLITFLGFGIFQLIAVAYGWLKEDNIILIGYLLSFITCGSVSALIILYRNK
ncbi:MAG: PQ-loop domain-containing transporter [Gammaproteobacteria bacterium]